MTRKRKKRVPESDFNELLVQALRTTVALANRGVSIAEEQASKRKLFKTYPYLDQALTNVKNVLEFFRSNLKPQKKEATRKVKKNERTKGKKGKKGRKKVSKSKALRHSR